MTLKLRNASAPNDGKENGYKMVRVGKTTWSNIRDVAKKSGKTLQSTTEELIAYAISNIEWED